MSNVYWTAWHVLENGKIDPLAESTGNKNWLGEGVQKRNPDVRSLAGVQFKERYNQAGMFIS